MMDIIITDRGWLVGFTPLSTPAQEWFADNVGSEPWQWMGPTLWVDHRPAQQLLDGIQAEGFDI